VIEVDARVPAARRTVLLVATWPRTGAELTAAQCRIAASGPPVWRLPAGPLLVAGCFVCFPRAYTGAGAAGDPAWAGATLFEGRRRAAGCVAAGTAGAPYEPGLLALREGALLEAAVRALPTRPDVLLVNATGRDHPRRCGLALHLGAALDLPTVGVTHRTLLADGDWPDDSYGAMSVLRLAGETVGYWVRTRRGTRPIAVHAAWRTDPAAAAAVVLRSWCPRRTPQPLREARRMARLARAGAGVSESRVTPAT
jgi:deoxyribonuclease V